MIQSTTPKLLIVDEFWSLMGEDHSALKVRLRTLPGIPNATFTVDPSAQADKQVFVFEKLVQNVAARLQGGLDSVTDADLQGVADAAMEEARMSALEAVTRWHVNPRGVKVEPIRPSGDNTLDSGFALVHHPFDAILGEFGSMDSARAVLADLLVHGVPDGQPMRFRQDLDIGKLSPLPQAVEAITPGQERGQGPLLGYSPILASLVYLEGCQALTPGVFEALRIAEQRWSEVRQEVARQTGAHHDKIWSLLEQMFLFVGGLGAKQPGEPLVDPEAIEKATALQHLYPELRAVSASMLYSLYDQYQDECLYMTSWEPGRDQEFALYALGQALMVDGRVSGNAARDLGAFLVYARHIAGCTLVNAMSQASACAKYDLLISKMVWRVREILYYLHDRKAYGDHVGSPVTTFGDTLAAARKYNYNTVLMSQSIE